MKHSDFSIGTEFYTATGQRWRCTDVGKRTVLAIELDPLRPESWYAGPPYVVPEVPFDELDIRRAYRTYEEAVHQAVARAEQSRHPGYPHEVVVQMMEARLSDEARTYPNPRLLRVDRIGDSGDLLHPYAAERDGDGWKIRIYQPLSGAFQALPEEEFIRLRPATEADLTKP